MVSAAVRRDGPAGRPADGLAFDDRRDGVVDVVPPARVLLVTDDPAGTGPLRAALAPRAAAAAEAGGVAGDPAVVTVAGRSAWVAAVDGPVRTWSCWPTWPTWAATGPTSCGGSWPTAAGC